MDDRLLQLVVNGVMAGAILAVPAIGLTTIFAVLRFVNFAVAGHMAVGAYAGYILNTTFGLPAWISVAGAFAGAAAVGVASDHAALRPLRAALPCSAPPSRTGRVPRPGWRSIRPSSLSSDSALRIVTRATPN